MLVCESTHLSFQCSLPGVAYNVVAGNECIFEIEFVIDESMTVSLFSLVSFFVLETLFRALKNEQESSECNRLLLPKETLLSLRRNTCNSPRIS